jgi:formate hydrogenlyase subunit 3/multisubunit Na+/H+ antiporter MnhD subunit
MPLILISLALMVLGGLVALALGRRRAAGIVGAASTVLGGAVGLVGLVGTMTSGQDRSITLPWNGPLGGSLELGVDGLSALFLLLVLGLSALAAIYGTEYLRPWQGRKNLGLHWFFFNILAASMAAVCLAQNGLLFLLAWEAMSLSSYFLVMFEDERPEVRRAGWVYLVATHLGTACLLALFVMMAGKGGGFDFSDYARQMAAGGPAVTAAFVLAVIGFGTKAGFMPMHIWLPEAHPAAPSHVSALMSGVMIKTGIYGLLRTLTFLGTPEPWWGWTLIGIGALSGVLGVLFALAQHDLKRLLAYHSVENIGIIALGIGVGLVGLSMGSPVVAALGLAGGLLHVANHAVFKSLLFFGAGAVRHATGTLEIDHLGGLQKKMPWTAATFLIGAAAISGLPPLNGFISEFLIYLGSYKSVATLGGSAGAPTLLAIGSLALIGGLAAACFTKVFGVIFLGEPRSAHVATAHEVGLPMRGAMLILAAACLLIGLGGPLIVGTLGPAVAVVAGKTEAEVAESLTVASTPLWAITAAAAGFLVLVGGLALVRRRLLAHRTVEAAGTWDCGYVRPTARMQYTASSFVQPIVRMFRFVLLSRRRFTPPAGLLPGGSQFETQTPDLFNENMWQPVFVNIRSVLGRFRTIQHGRIQLYVMYLVLTLLALLVWKLS